MPPSRGPPGARPPLPPGLGKAWGLGPNGGIPAASAPLHRACAPGGVSPWQLRSRPGFPGRYRLDSERFLLGIELVPEGARECVCEHLKAFDDEINAFLDNMFGPRDARVRGWFMLDSYLPTFFLTVIYLLSIWLGNKYMKNRPALSLRSILTLYNLAITLLSAYMLAELILSSWEGGYNLQCQDLASAGEADVRVAKVLWWYYFSKSVEFLDTIFFVLRKKTSQITFLHVYHHASMFNIWWCVLNWIPCGQSFFGPTLNSFIHILMYSYYGLSVFPSMHKYLWWKKYLTQAQLVQFVLTITHTMSAVVKPCGFPFSCLIFQSSYMLTLVILFLNFYIQTYQKKPMKKKDTREPPAVKEVKNGFSKAYFTAVNGVMNKKAQYIKIE
ncbi:elongation of very long chain fatty acids protein 2 [Lemur catta]|uniref:elongation of very long chain fatty acids protein 2 n=1 Tax=Lemur catta TaxID=9447 RepID=UPI001E266E78|nr:elongation of very long chain fatty acids protein 2 [Lemur catta]